MCVVSAGGMVAAIAAIVSVKSNVSMVDATVCAAAVAAAPARVAARMSSMWPMALVARCSSGWTLSQLMSAGDSCSAITSFTVADVSR